MKKFAFLEFCRSTRNPKPRAWVCAPQCLWFPVQNHNLSSCLCQSRKTLFFTCHISKQVNKSFFMICSSSFSISQNKPFIDTVLVPWYCVVKIPIQWQCHSLVKIKMWHCAACHCLPCLVNIITYYHLHSWPTISSYNQWLNVTSCLCRRSIR